MRELFLEDDEINLILNFLPDGNPPKGLDPMFYHTLTYEGDVKIQERADQLREKLEGDK